MGVGLAVEEVVEEQVEVGVGVAVGLEVIVALGVTVAHRVGGIGMPAHPHT